jgi:23S rRNA (guanosine2251-2'-O)-methyltransferase
MPFAQVTNLARALRDMKEAGLWIAGAAGDGEKELHAADLTGALAIVMGSEGKGLRRLTRECCDFTLRLPMRGAVRSLNVSVAAGITLTRPAPAQRQGCGNRASPVTYAPLAPDLRGFFSLPHRKRVSGGP